MMNELADKVDAELVEFEKAVDRLLFTTRIAKTQEYEELASLLIECRSEVIKALRFAADMEKLMPHMPGFWIEKGVCRCAFDAVAGDASVRTIVNGADYYSAARKAVDALEKGESDGK